MRLINTSDYTLHEIYEPGDDHPYAILSHTWDESEHDPRHREVTFRDIQDLAVARKLTGWVKVWRTCELARNRSPPLRWAWIDTCCIDKSSSAELTEAINSMFRWYMGATVCFAFLEDLSPSAADLNTRARREDLARCRWFTRGWTLQELIAPQHLIFYDARWNRRGSKSTLVSEISHITRIDKEVLEDRRRMATVAVGRRMSWASNRNTKRVEDTAYCLFGIFDINMPLIYGEGPKAFLRLQEALMHQSDDLSLFAWSSDTQEIPQSFHGMLARSPKNFRECHNLVRQFDPVLGDRHSFAVTNRGLEFRTPLLCDIQKSTYLLTLGCVQSATSQLGDAKVLAVSLVRTLKGFARATGRPILLPDQVWTNSTGHTVRVPVSLSEIESQEMETRHHHAITFRIKRPKGIHLTLHCGLGPPRPVTGENDEVPQAVATWDRITYTFLTGGERNFSALVWPKLLCYPTGVEDKFSWPHDLWIACGLRPGQFGSWVPFAVILGDPQANGVEFKGKSTYGLTSIRQDMSQTTVEDSYRHVVSYLRRDMEVAKLPTSCTLIPSISTGNDTGNQKSKALRHMALSMDLKCRSELNPSSARLTHTIMIELGDSKSIYNPLSPSIWGESEEPEKLARSENGHVWWELDDDCFDYVYTWDDNKERLEDAWWKKHLEGK